MQVLITGGTGYIGSTIALDLARRGHRVTAAARARGSSAPSRVKELEVERRLERSGLP